jgi:hypothetical protein
MSEAKPSGTGDNSTGNPHRGGNRRGEETCGRRRGGVGGKAHVDGILGAEMVVHPREPRVPAGLDLGDDSCKERASRVCDSRRFHVCRRI